jgi:signal transduction histidine kinase
MWAIPVQLRVGNSARPEEEWDAGPAARTAAGKGGSASTPGGAGPRIWSAARDSRDFRAWLFPLAVITMIAISAGVLAPGLPPGAAGATAVALLVVAGILSAVALCKRIDDPRVLVPALVGVGLCGAALDWQTEGPGFVAGYVSLMGLALRTPRRIAILAGIPVVAAIAAEETYQSANPATTFMAVVFASGLLFISSSFAAVSSEARHHAEVLLAQQTAIGEARQRAAALAERSRLAHDLHDVLAHSLSALAVQLEAARLTAITTGAGARLVGEVESARKLTSIGLLEAQRALQMLREDEAPGPGSVPALVSQTAGALGIPITLQVCGASRPLGADAGLTLYRVVQEALTNVAKHAGRGARVAVRLVWAPDGVEVSIVDSGGDGASADLPSSGRGLAGMVDRATLFGGRLDAGPADGGFAVHLWLPTSASVLEKTP